MSGHEEDPPNPEAPVTWTEYTRLREMLQQQLHDGDNGVRDELGEVQTELNNLGDEVTQLRTTINTNFLELLTLFAQHNLRGGVQADDASVHGPPAVLHNETEEECAIRGDEERR